MIRRSFRNGLGRPRAVWLLCLLLVPSLLLTAACGNAMGKRYPPYRYRLTVEVETPQGLRTGSSVIEVHTAVAGPNSVPSPAQVFKRIRGEAVAIDLPNGQTLFALLRSDGDTDWASHVYAWLVPHLSQQEVKARSQDGKWSSQLDFDLWTEQILVSRGRKSVPRTWNLMGQDINNWPMFVRFRNIHDPASIEPVDPDKLSQSLGKGYHVRGIWAERTEDQSGGQTSAYLDARFWRLWGERKNAALRDGVLGNPYFESLAGKLVRDDFVAD